MSKKNIYLFIVIVSFTLTSACYANTNDLPYAEGQLLIRFSPKALGLQRTVNEQNQILSALNAGEVKHSFKRIPGLTLVKLPENLKVAGLLPTWKKKLEI
jgi:hypothetical protein